MRSRLWVLGENDREMYAIERILRGAGERVAYGLDRRGERLEEFLQLDLPEVDDQVRSVYLVECYPREETEIAHMLLSTRERVVFIDHNHPGSPGYGLPPELFLPASSLGQVLRHLICDCWSGDLWATLEEEGCWITGFLHDAYEEHLGERDQWHYVDGRGWRIAAPSAIVYASRELLEIAALDHCRSAALVGACPGVRVSNLV